MLTDFQQTYRNFFGQETRTGAHIIVESGHDKQEIPVICEIVLKPMWFHFVCFRVETSC